MKALKFFYEEDGHTSEMDADNELNQSLGPTQNKGTRRSQLKQCWAQKVLQRVNKH